MSMTLLKWKFRHVKTILALLFLLVPTATRADQFGVKAHLE